MVDEFEALVRAALSGGATLSDLWDTARDFAREGLTREQARRVFVAADGRAGEELPRETMEALEKAISFCQPDSRVRWTPAIVDKVPSRPIPDPQKRLAAIRKVLMDEWDPVGINDVPQCADEYDSYAQEIFERARRGAVADEIRNYLQSVETESMGPRRAASRGLLALAERLVALQPARE